MATRYGCSDTEDVPPIQDSPLLDLAQKENLRLDGDNESSDEYPEEIDTHWPLDKLLEQFC